LVKQPIVYKKGNAEERVVKDVERLCIVESSRKCTLSEEIENDEGDYYVFPSKEYEKIGQSVLEPSSVM
jgi:hypothetical protein